MGSEITSGTMWVNSLEEDKDSISGGTSFRNPLSILNFVHNLIHVDAVRVSLLLVVAIPASVQQDLVLLVLLGVQHVVAGR